ncbi:MAG: response regulator [Candidatus Poribacteria bacterium]|nr:response regulator [Candidatus Poribacteria bacterium]
MNRATCDTNNGRLGIGRTNPQEKLHLNGRIKINSQDYATTGLEEELRVIRGTVKSNGEIESQPNVGTTFSISLPIFTKQAADDSDSDEVPRSGPLHILAVDDEPRILGAIVEYLSIDGHTVEIAENGREGLSKFAASWFDVVITDLAMPDMNGDALAAAIKKEAPEEPILLLTGFAEMLEVVEEKPEGVDMVVSKPVTLANLRKALAEIVH